MLAITLADLRYRSRQFLIAVVGAGVVFALAVLMSGMANGFHAEITKTVNSTHADRWVVPTSSSGPFTSVRAIPENRVGAVRSAKGVKSAAGMVISLQTVDRGSKGLIRVMMLGAQPGPTTFVPSRGSAVVKPGDAVADERLGLDIGQHFTLGTQRFTVVGLTSGHTMLGGTPDVFVGLRAAQQVLFGGQRLVTAVSVQGTPTSLPKGLKEMSIASVEKDSLGPMADSVSSVENTRYLMWAVAVIIVAALIYVSTLQRTRDFAVLKAVGASGRDLFVSVAVQAVLVTLGAAALAASTAWLFRPLYLVPLVVPASAYWSLPVIAVVVGLISSLIAMRRAVTVDPALAFGAGA
ncbi:ABC transporter permease [Nocardioides marmorisolisilvae]|uniref:FtsX-like permease family protein n=1 Tax=Nocardioides marmorisolisilvae TaxID=1542737 RepID=A0A3N0DU95_9ACTN|nr:FtsX-like permease family protein [Nocardioides marmorisolisilvae]RNL79178.1 FtsX-like permease family protein [Nocardioides marmorisolisilvae]